MLSISTCGSPFESQGPRFLWGAVKVHTLCGTISYGNWDSGPQLWNQVTVLCKGTWQASMVCSISPGVHHKIVTNNKKHSTGQIPRACQVSHGFLGDIQEISNQTRCRNFFSQGSVCPCYLLLPTPGLLIEVNTKLAKSWHVGKRF